jgi:cellulose synthase/poly-beta-1,6-N-acetylglucosamine synthase-like glycosyltransferase
VADTYYYNSEKEEEGTSFGFHMRALGEDRYLTYLLTKTDTKPYQICFVPNAQCKTDAPDSFPSFLKQRRRWLLGSMACETYMMTSPTMWKRFPLMLVYKMFIYESRSLEWFSWIALLSLFLNYGNIAEDLGLLLFPLTFLLKYTILFIFCIFSKRAKICIFYIALIIFMPFFTITVVLYSIFTWNVRSWGGPRTEGQKLEITKVQLLKRVMVMGMGGLENPGFVSVDVDTV